MNHSYIILLISIISTLIKCAQPENALELEFKSVSEEAMRHYYSIRMIFDFLQEALKAEFKKTPLLISRMII